MEVKARRWSRKSMEIRSEFNNPKTPKSSQPKSSRPKPSRPKSSRTCASCLPGWSCKRLAISTAGSLQYLGGHEAHVPGEILPSIPNSNHKEGDLWDQATLWRDAA
ncbi:hypothetical protein CR513_02185, partial [Mucuna pruriens]